MGAFHLPIFLVVASVRASTVHFATSLRGLWFLTHFMSPFVKKTGHLSSIGPADMGRIQSHLGNGGACFLGLVMLSNHLPCLHVLSICFAYCILWDSRDSGFRDHSLFGYLVIWQTFQYLESCYTRQQPRYHTSIHTYIHRVHTWHLGADHIPRKQNTPIQAHTKRTLNISLHTHTSSAPLCL
jgi:hypothetical protein